VADHLLLHKHDNEKVNPMNTLPSRTLLIRLLVLLALPAALSSAQAATRTVCKSGCEFSRINAAVQAAASGDTISIAAGTYFENVVVTNKNLTISGDSEDGTVIDGGWGGTTLTVTGELSSNATLTNGTVSLNQLTLTHGSASGLVLSGLTGTLYKLAVISNLSANEGTGAGGGIQILDSNITILNSIVAHNRATLGNGGGISADRTVVTGSTVTLTHTDIFDNSALFGGGVFIGPLSTMTLSSGVLSSNNASYGAGVFLGTFTHLNVEETGLLIFNSSTMANNHASISGGGISVLQHGDGLATFDHSFIVGNASGGPGGGIELNPDGSVTLTDTLVAGNSPDNCAGQGTPTCP
jgi:hypothetical protein